MIISWKKKNEINTQAGKDTLCTGLPENNYSFEPDKAGIRLK